MLMVYIHNYVMLYKTYFFAALYGCRPAELPENLDEKPPSDSEKA
jgi:hypothetical protein